MSFVQQFKSDLFNTSSENFEEKCLSLFRFQFEFNSVYRNYVEALRVDLNQVNSIAQIPFLPITLFKTYKVKSTSLDLSEYFESSGTTGTIRSRLYFQDKDLYLRNSINIFEKSFGKLSDFSFFFLLPNYLERQNSSLVAMADHFYTLSDKRYGGFYLHDTEKLKVDLNKALKTKSEKIVLWGVTFALLDFAENPSSEISGFTIIETGGMKGRRKEPLRSEVHAVLSQAFDTKKIYSEYGMTELFSQAYTIDNSSTFVCSNQMKVLIREPEDPRSVHTRKMERGGVNIIDLANIDSCAFIETQDLGMLTKDGFEILGRFDNSEIRGCNLLVLGR